jgi:probable rRNA maturation factor
VSDHFLHLVLHGILHLIGYDHEIEADAVTMESLEVAVLKEVGVQDPYEVTVDE